MYALLIVDDDMCFAKGLEILLRNQKRVIYKAYSVKEAIEIIKEHNESLDLICSDYAMRDGTCIDLMEYIKVQNINCPVIVISARDEEEYIKQAQSSGVALYIPKIPLETQKIRESISYILQNSVKTLKDMEYLKKENSL